MRVSLDSRVNGDPECRWCGKLECDGEQCFDNEAEALREQWSEAGGTAMHPVVRKELHKQARKLGIKLPGMK